MEENGLRRTDEDQFPSVISREVSELQSKVNELENEVDELKKDLQAVDLLQRQPIISSDALAIGGFWVVAALAIIGIFFI